MKWRKMGRIYVPDGSLWWAQKYAFPPTPLLMDESTIRIYLACTDENNVGRIGYVDLDAGDPSNIIRVAQEPVLGIGQPGAFDENGVLPTSVLRVGDEIWMYYVGYQLGYKVRYFQFQGLAISRDGGESFLRYSRVPVIDRSDAEFANRTSAFVIQEKNLFRMWYVGGSEWTYGKDGKYLPVYNMKYLESKDGKEWPQEGRTVIDFCDEDEHALGKPWVWQDGNIYRMLFSTRRRSRGYRIGYAESQDGIEWQRKDDESGIDVAPEGWDSEMIAYGSTVQVKGSTYLFYNGNNCGETGFGLASLMSL